MDPNFADQLWAIVRQSPLLQVALDGLAQLNLPAGYLGAGCLAQTVWNAAHGYTLTAHIKDIDLVYFDAGDLSYEGEDQVIQRAAPLFAAMPVQVDIKNQARVHLWYAAKFGQAMAPYGAIEQAVASWPTTATALAIRPVGASYDLCAPFGLDDLFSLTVRPNKRQVSQAVYEAKCERWQRCWPRLTILPW
ncbi:MAG: nucleotidyltransferase family protein [Anaerolineales bacterium]|nr:nucleotidyltransferase family protein [Anaerolineales bacterium]